MAFRKSGDRNYLYLAVGGLLLLALLVVLAYSVALPIEGCVGVMEIKGPIIADDVPASVFTDEVKGSESIVSALQGADRRPEVKSVLILDDSPGGSVVASKDIYDAIRAMNKTTVAYINELAASGGYYVASAADYIMAQPDALTGNIGARATFADLSGLFAKIGFNETTVKTGAMKDMGSPSRPMTPEELSVMREIVNESFAQFRSDVEEGRAGKLDRAGFEKILDARILTGRQAKKIGLIDELGNKRAAIMKAAALGSITSEEPRTCEISSGGGRKGLLGSISSEALDLVAKGAGVPRLLYQ